MKINKINEEKIKKDAKQEEIKNYNSSKNYEIDFRRINGQNDNFREIIKSLSEFINNLKKCIKNNTKILDQYSEDSLNIESYTNLLKLSSSIEDIYEDTLKNFESISKEIKKIYKSGIQKLKDNYINDFNKKYRTCLIENKNYVGFRDFLDEGNYHLHYLDEVKFKELCRIDFKNIRDLELKFEDNINIDVLLKASYINLSFLGLIGKIKNIEILSKLPFKSLNTLFLGNNYFDNLDIFRKMPFTNLKVLILSGNKINNISGLSKAPFYDLNSLYLTSDSITDIKPLEEIPFKNLEELDLSNNNIENIDCLSNLNIPKLRILGLSGNKIININVFSKVMFHNLVCLRLKYNQIKDINIFSKTSFNNLRELDLRNNLINNINFLNQFSLTNFRRLYISYNKINNFDVLLNINMNAQLTIYIDKRQHYYLSNIINKLRNIIINKD